MPLTFVLGARLVCIPRKIVLIPEDLAHARVDHS